MRERESARRLGALQLEGGWGLDPTPRTFEGGGEPPPFHPLLATGGGWIGSRHHLPPSGPRKLPPPSKGGGWLPSHPSSPPFPPAQNCNPSSALGARCPTLQLLQHFGSTGAKNCNPYDTFADLGSKIATPTALWGPGVRKQPLQHFGAPGSES